MEIHKTYTLDVGPGFKYEYDIYDFIEPDFTLRARSYFSEPDEAHFLAKLIGDKTELLAESDLYSVSFHAAVEHLRSEGKTRINWLSSEGYAPIPRESTA